MGSSNLNSDINIPHDGHRPSSTCVFLVGLRPRCIFIVGLKPKSTCAILIGHRPCCSYLDGHRPSGLTASRSAIILHAAMDPPDPKTPFPKRMPTEAEWEAACDYSRGRDYSRGGPPYTPATVDGTTGSGEEVVQLIGGHVRPGDRFRICGPQGCWNPGRIGTRGCWQPVFWADAPGSTDKPRKIRREEVYIDPGQVYTILRIAYKWGFVAAQVRVGDAAGMRNVWTNIAKYGNPWAAVVRPELPAEQGVTRGQAEGYPSQSPEVPAKQQEQAFEVFECAAAHEREGNPTWEHARDLLLAHEAALSRTEASAAPGGSDHMTKGATAADPAMAPGDTPQEQQAATAQSEDEWTRNMLPRHHEPSPAPPLWPVMANSRDMQDHAWVDAWVREDRARLRWSVGAWKHHFIQASHDLSKVLRHSAKREGLHMREDGYVAMKDLMKLARFRQNSHEEIIACVEHNSKQRFRLITEAGEELIRAQQGHTAKVCSINQRALPVGSPSDESGDEDDIMDDMQEIIQRAMQEELHAEINALQGDGWVLSRADWHPPWEHHDFGATREEEIQGRRWLTLAHTDRLPEALRWNLRKVQAEGDGRLTMSDIRRSCLKCRR